MREAERGGRVSLLGTARAPLVLPSARGFDANDKRARGGRVAQICRHLCFTGATFYLKKHVDMFKDLAQAVAVYSLTIRGGRYVCLLA